MQNESLKICFTNLKFRQQAARTTSYVLEMPHTFVEWFEVVFCESLHGEVYESPLHDDCIPRCVLCLLSLDLRPHLTRYISSLTRVLGSCDNSRYIRCDNSGCM